MKKLLQLLAIVSLTSSVVTGIVSYQSLKHLNKTSIKSEIKKNYIQSKLDASVQNKQMTDEQAIAALNSALNDVKGISSVQVDKPSAFAFEDKTYNVKVVLESDYKWDVDNFDGQFKVTANVGNYDKVIKQDIQSKLDASVQNKQMTDEQAIAALNSALNDVKGISSVQVDKPNTFAFEDKTYNVKVVLESDYKWDVDNFDGQFKVTANVKKITTIDQNELEKAFKSGILQEYNQKEAEEAILRVFNEKIDSKLTDPPLIEFKKIGTEEWDKEFEITIKIKLNQDEYKWASEFSGEFKIQTALNSTMMFYKVEGKNEILSKDFKETSIEDWEDIKITEIIEFGWYSNGQVCGIFFDDENNKSVSSIFSQYSQNIIFPEKLNKNITSLKYLFYNLTRVTNLRYISGWDTSNVTDMSYMFSEAWVFDQDISGWDTSNVTDMSNMFSNASAFNHNISGWDTSNVTDMSNMFNNAHMFDQDISKWDTSNVTDMSGMFRFAYIFNHDISGWDTSNVTDMSYMFSSARVFDQNISTKEIVKNGIKYKAWDTSNVTDMSSMFFDASEFNHNISGWDTSNVTDMSYMFSSAHMFDQDISKWNTSNVTDMTYMFSEAWVFDQDISGWDTSNVTDMSYMFFDAWAFDQNISTKEIVKNGIKYKAWDTSNVTDMSGMFSSALVFNQDISGWDTSNVTDMSGMFFDASAFNHDISGWDVKKVENYFGFYNDNGIWKKEWQPNFSKNN
ncbi:BspA family leucine-rich repeat surface protein [Mesoplasma florum]|uniref:Chitinase n=1 Tax=Mesoplasma florum TaxID=2151 RepID=A0AAD0MPW0_MESFO|nr:BspA family leucine-rich repeat surface protein [Mesoplasma florum]AVN59862.1 hypothetical protein CG008_03125 [Mesoplasma florum]AVN65996.1 Chitinase [Mesoplasma florum]